MAEETVPQGTPPAAPPPAAAKPPAAAPVAESAPPEQKIKVRKPRQRSCDEKDAKGKLCAGHLKRWYDYPKEVEAKIGKGRGNLPLRVLQDAVQARPETDAPQFYIAVLAALFTIRFFGLNHDCSTAGLPATFPDEVRCRSMIAEPKQMRTTPPRRGRTPGRPSKP